VGLKKKEKNILKKSKIKLYKLLIKKYKEIPKYTFWLHLNAYDF